MFDRVSEIWTRAGAMIAEKLIEIEGRIKEAKVRAGREREEITLIAVSKKQPFQKMIELEEAFAKRGAVATFGENYVQEYSEKRSMLSGKSRAHLIGSLQRNKAKDAVALFDLIESVHTAELAHTLDREAAKIKKIQDILFQVNISSDDAKNGFTLEGLTTFLKETKSFPSLRALGVMTITKLYDNPEDARGDFKALKTLALQLKADFPKIFVGERMELSMGMSADFQIAIEEGATMVRIGTALFGERE